MSLWNRLTGEFVDVIDWTEQGRDQMVWRFERHGAAIKYGAKLTVREGQAAVFVHEGQVADVFAPGLWVLETNNMPVMTTLQHWDHGFRSPFLSDVWFVSLRRFADLKWGTKNPVILRDPEFGPVRLRAFGSFAIRVTDPAKFLTEIVGTDGDFSTDEVAFQLRNLIVARASAALASSQIPVLDLAANADQLAELLKARIAPELAACGIETPEFYIENMSMPPEVEAALDRRTQMGIVGDLTKYEEFQRAEAIRAAASTPGSAMGTMIGMGFGQAAATAVPPRTEAAATPPPPPAAEPLWHVAENGATRGPFTRTQIAEMAATGALAPGAHVWTQGAAGWTRAAETPALAGLFPPPPPPPPGA
jgi:membrane protease subunit (stomatin/prohibitin family)